MARQAAIHSVIGAHWMKPFNWRSGSDIWNVAQLTVKLERTAQALNKQDWSNKIYSSTSNYFIRLEYFNCLFDFVDNDISLFLTSVHH